VTLRRFLAGLAWSVLVLLSSGAATHFMLNTLEGHLELNVPGAVRALVVLVGMLVPYRLLCGQFISDMQALMNRQEKREES
jgi:hypothetical protein